LLNNCTGAEGGKAAPYLAAGYRNDEPPTAGWF
jgi:hypothetical protein